eukprot:4911168-Prymnesium_polylepis.2
MEVAVPAGLQPGQDFDILVPMPAATPPAPAAAPPPAAVPPQTELEQVWLGAPARELPELGQSIQNGEVVVCVKGIASEPELAGLFAAGVAACNTKREMTGRTPATGRNRFAVSDPDAFSSDVVLSCEEILLRVLDVVDEQIPSVYETLFRPSARWASRQPLNAQGQQPTELPPLYLEDTCPSLRELYMAGELEWSEGEPAINVYTENGFFGAHKDHLALTVLIPLTSPTQDFAGGGTGFWAGNRAVDENPQSPPTTVLKPPLGTALVFGGDLTHAGMPVEAGMRSVFVASFSTRTPASAKDRVQGLQVNSFGSRV